MNEEGKEIKLAEFFNDRYIWIRSQDGGETLILREYWKGEKRRCRGTTIPKTKDLNPPKL